MRLLQSPSVRQLEQPTSRFLHQIGLRARVDVLQVAPLHLLITTNCNPASQETLSRQLHFLYNIDEARGDQMMVVRGRVPFSLLDQHWVLALLGAGCFLVGLGSSLGLKGWAARPTVHRPERRRWPARLLKLSPWLTLAGIFAAGLPILCLPLNLLVLLWWKVRQKPACQRPIVNGKQEAAILLMSYPPEFSAQVFKEMGPDVVHTITLEISKLPPIGPDLRASVRDTFEGLVLAGWPKATPESLTPPMICSTLQRFYLNSSLQGNLSATSTPVSKVRRSFRPALALFGSLLIWLVCLGPWGWLLATSTARPSLESDLRHFVRLDPLAVVQVERNGQTRSLVGLGSPDLNSLKSLVTERSQALGMDPSSIACLGVQYHRNFPFRLLLGMGLAGLLLLALRRRTVSRPVKAPPATPVVAPPQPTAPVMIPAQPVPATPVLKPAEPKKSENLRNLEVDEITFEVGRGLLCLVDPNQGAKLLERVTSIRRQTALKLGLIIPGVRFRDDLSLNSDEYVVRIRGVERARGNVEVNKFLAIGPEDKLAQMKGTRAREPVFGETGVWIEPGSRHQAEMYGLVMLDPVSLIATRLTYVLSEHAWELLGFSACADLLKQPQLSALIEELEQRELDRVKLWQVLREMLRQQVSIREMPRILEGLLVDGFSGATIDELVELARLAVRDGIVADLCHTELGKAPGPLVVWRVSEELLDLLEAGQDQHCELLEKFQLLAQRMLNAGHQPVVLVEPVYRSVLQKMLTPLKNLRVLSAAELPDWVQLQFFRGEGKL